jgi:hypothetical protein
VNLTSSLKLIENLKSIPLPLTTSSITDASLLGGKISWKKFYLFSAAVALRLTFCFSATATVGLRLALALATDLASAGAD